MTGQTDIILETHALTKEFGGFTAVKDVALSVARGSIHALIGPNGAGKTTCFHMLTKFIAPTRGTVIFEGRDITRERPHEIAKLGIARSFQISAIFPYLTLIENVRLALQRKLGLSYFFWQPAARLDVLNERALELLAAVGLADRGDEIAADLSYGRKRALEIATTLALEPKLLLLDEPMAGLGREDVGKIAALIRSISANRTILMVEHNIGVVAELSNFITVLHRGEILAEGTYADISRDPAVVSAYLGTGHDD
jgi:branched-chain amino acid transport system ATP-binding protein